MKGSGVGGIGEGEVENARSWVDKTRRSIADSDSDDNEISCEVINKMKKRKKEGTELLDHYFR